MSFSSSYMSNRKITTRRFLFAAFVILALLTGGLCARRAFAVAEGSDDAAHQMMGAARAKDEVETQIESALYTRAEFFGARALVSYPTAEARNRLADVARKYPHDARVHLRLAKLDEQLAQFEEAEREMRSYVADSHEELTSLEELASFFHRRARFEDEAATLERELQSAPVERRAEILRQLFETARVHKIERYLSAEFYGSIVAQNDSVFAVVSDYVEKLVEEEDYAGALKAVRELRGNFPAQRIYFLQQETSILDASGDERAAESVYRAAFDPFWPDEMSESFYTYLKDHDRFRAYGRELQSAFARDPTNYDAAVRLFHFRTHAYQETAGIFARLEKARAARGVKWTPDELATVARLLIRDGDGDGASRFLYTLYANGKLEKQSPLRAQVLYQMFELLTDAADNRLSLTRGDLKFYEDIAATDSHPGIIGGVLSLILSDTNPRGELEKEESVAVKYFNRAAAYRIFDAYRREYPTSPELAQMYLDIVRLYTATKEPQVAADALAEFERRYTDAPQYPSVALKLADAYVAAGQPEREREIYARILDYFGKHRQPGTPLIPAAKVSSDAATTDDRAEIAAPLLEPTDSQPSVAEYPAKSNPGVTITTDEGETNSYDYSEQSVFSDHLTARGSEQTSLASVEEKTEETVTYASVLSRYVASLAEEKRTGDILALYAGELKKYPEEQALNEQMLQWLGQTNMLDEQLRVYKETLKRFPTTLWQDRLARWFLRRDRKDEFETYSRELLEKMSDEEARAYLEKFIEAGASGSANNFDARLYLGLYTLAHERFPHDLNFVEGLLKYYSGHAQWNDWQSLVAEYYFVSPAIREQFLAHLASRTELRARFDDARSKCSVDASQVSEKGNDIATLPYKLFRADAAAWLSNYEEAIDAYRELNRLYPNTPEFSVRLISFTRSFGEHNRQFLEEAASVGQTLADAHPSNAEYRTRAGEIFAELGDYTRAGGEWEQLIEQGRGEPENYLDTATLYWDYYQYDRALATIKSLRAGINDQRLYAFQAGAIEEAMHHTPAALAEYAKGIDEESSEYTRAKKRLLTLFKHADVPAQFRVAFERERRGRADDSSLVFGYGELLKDAGQWDSAATLLKTEAARSESQTFLQRARGMFSDREDHAGEQLALRRLASVAKSQRLRISDALQLAESYEQNGDQRAAASTLEELVRTYPSNYGVLSEAADFHWRTGRRENAVSLLRQSAARAKGKFHYVFARKLAARLADMNRLAEAETVLASLQREDALDLNVFHELARIYLRTGNSVALAASFRETLNAMKSQDIDIKELHEQVAGLRDEMIAAFTRLKDYKSAIEQHIEIINRDPQDEEKLDAAIAYAARYGGADELLNYYLRTSRQAYKNYRWNVVLARIYEARGDTSAAVENYRAAIGNQPEMLELYDGLADVYARAKNYDAAAETLDKACELSNDDLTYVKRRIEMLEKAGRHAEADAARLKLPAAAPTPTQSGIKDQFAEAARLRGVEKEKAVAAYRQAFDALAAAPLKNDLQAAQITGYVQAVRRADGLVEVTRRLWMLRAKLMDEAEREGSADAGHARASVQTLDGALPEAVGGVAREVATGDELSALYNFLQRNIDESLQARDGHATLALLQNVSRRAGFDTLEEKILLARKDESFGVGVDNAADYHASLESALDYYVARGNFRLALELLDAEKSRDHARDSFDYERLTADYAQLSGDKARELDALRNYYRRTRADSAAKNDEMVARYFAALEEKGAAGRDELRAYALDANSPAHLQLINFLLARGEGELAHEAINAGAQASVWKSARNAEVSLALGEFAQANENYFLNALRWKTVGELVARPTDASRELAGDDWFQLSATYGRWLYKSSAPESHDKSRELLPALIENSPHDAAEQLKLGQWYLSQEDARAAFIHLQLASEAQPDDAQTLASVGAASFILGDKRRADESWARIISSETVSDEAFMLYLETLRHHGLPARAREKLTPLLVKRLQEMSDDDYPSSNDEGKKESLRKLIRAVAATFAKEATKETKEVSTMESPGEPATHKSEPGESASDESASDASAKASYFVKLCEAVPERALLPETLVNENLIARASRGKFYQLLIERSGKMSDSERDYDYVSVLDRVWDAGAAEEVYDHENNFKVSEPDGARVEWQQKYLAYLLEEHHDVDARRLVSEIESELSRRYARPSWLRLAGLQLDVRAGRIEQAVEGLKHLVGVTAGENVSVVAPPDVTRLNEAAAMLRGEKRVAEADSLLEEAEARTLALGKFEGSLFAELSSRAFKKGDAAFGLEVLRAMVKLARSETAPAAEAEVAEWPLVKAHAVTDAKVEAPQVENNLNESEALRLAAETAASSGQFDATIEFRRQLLVAAPDEVANRIELARVLDINNQIDEAVAQLASIIGDRDATRGARWQAVWVAPEIIGERRELWSSLAEGVRAANGADVEMLTATDALALVASGRNREALKLADEAKASDPNPYLKLFCALLHKKSETETDARDRLIEARGGDLDSQAAAAFGFNEDAPLRQLVCLSISLGQPRAALKFAGDDAELQPLKDDVKETVEDADDSNEGEQEAGALPASGKYQTLGARAEMRRAQTRVELLGLLSVAAEGTGDMRRALGFARARLALTVAGAAGRAEAVARVSHLRELQREKSKSGTPRLTIDGQLVARK